MNAYTWNQGWFNWTGYRHRVSWLLAWFLPMIVFIIVTSILVTGLEDQLAKYVVNLQLVLLLLLTMLVCVGFYGWISVCTLAQRSRDMNLPPVFAIVVYIIINADAAYTTYTGTALDTHLLAQLMGLALTIIMAFSPPRTHAVA